MNETRIMGRFTRDPEIRTSASGNECLHFTLAVRRRYYKTKDGTAPKRDVDFIPCVAWGGFAKSIAEKFKKGERITVGGALESNTYNDKDGKKKFVVQLRVNDFERIDPKPKEEVTEGAPENFEGTPVPEEEINIF